MSGSGKSEWGYGMIEMVAGFWGMVWPLAVPLWMAFWLGAYYQDWSTKRARSRAWKRDGGPELVEQMEQNQRRLEEQNARFFGETFADRRRSMVADKHLRWMRRTGEGDDVG